MSGGGSGGTGIGIYIGGVTVQVPYADSSQPFTQELLDLSLCVVILQMASAINNSDMRTAIHSAASKALGIESQQFAKETAIAV